MPRKKNQKRSDGLYEYKATIGKDITGRAIRKSFYSSKSRADAKKKAEQYRIAEEASLHTGIASVCESGGFADWARRWLETYKKPFVSANTYRLTYENIVEKHLIPYFGDADLPAVMPIHITEFFATKKACSPDRLKHMRSILSAIFLAAIENDLCYKNPVAHAQWTSEAEKRTPTIYDDEQIQAAVDYLSEHLPEAALMLETGIRRGEMCGLMWADYDRDNRTLSINRSIAVGANGERIEERPPKWGSYRTIPLSKVAVRILEAQPQSSLYIFPNRSGQPSNPNSWSQKFTRHIKAMQAETGLPELRPHDLRKTYGTALRRKGVDIYTIQKLLGHKDITVTTEVYVANEVAVLRENLSGKGVV